jgi:hypothetical protein
MQEPIQPNLYGHQMYNRDYHNLLLINQRSSWSRKRSQSDRRLLIQSTYAMKNAAMATRPATAPYEAEIWVAAPVKLAIAG